MKSMKEVIEVLIEHLLLHFELPYFPDNTYSFQTNHNSVRMEAGYLSGQTIVKVRQSISLVKLADALNYILYGKARKF